ncbi:hypothetical protein FA13DRAFT_1707425 [Coprinellus micaceus]|uniref:Uncharacterized protein n=1 Tax=Coprinellus micaceus TaxID=71717 RepID=A0A4Y7TKM4_COPMI|nr:hypothetical protein FA13DRAFT_1707425 [Coprinellus micaceus]
MLHLTNPDGSPQGSIRVEDAGLSELLKNPHVHELHQTVLCLTVTQGDLFKENQEVRITIEALRAENASLWSQQQRFPSHARAASSSISPSDSVSQVPVSPLSSTFPPSTFANTDSLPPCPDQSSICPSNYNTVSICWTKADYAKNPANTCMPANKSWPKMLEALHNPRTYQALTQVQWDSLRSMAGNYPTQWRAAIWKLEEKEPITTYCAGSWKAIEVFRVVLRRGQNGSSTMSQGEGGVEDSEGDGNGSNDRNGGDANQEKKRPRRSTVTACKKAKVVNPNAQVGEEVQGEKPPGQELNVHQEISKPLASASQSKPVVQTIPTIVDISFIQVDHSLEILKGQGSLKGI